MSDWDDIKSKKQTVDVHEFELYSDLSFTISYQFFYAGEMYLHLMAPAVAVGVSKLGKVIAKNKVIILPEDLKNLEDKIVFKNYTGSDDTISISEKDQIAFEKRFRVPLAKYAAYQLRKAVENLRLNVTPISAHLVESVPHIKYFRLINGNSQVITDEYLFGISINNQVSEHKVNVLSVKSVDIPAPILDDNYELPELF